MAKEKIKIPEKFYYSVEVESLVPATLIFRVLAEDAEQALELAKRTNPNDIKYRLINRKDKQVKIKKWGTCIIELTKSLVNILR